MLGLPDREADGRHARGTSPNSSRKRTNGERPRSARTSEGASSRSAAVMNIDTSGALPRRTRMGQA